MSAKTVIQRDALWLALVWDGTNLHDFKNHFKRFDFNTLEAQRIVAIPSSYWPPLSLSDENLECISLSINDVLIKSLQNGDVNNLYIWLITRMKLKKKNKDNI
jgi:hypothetical protein